MDISLSIELRTWTAIVIQFVIHGRCFQASRLSGLIAIKPLVKLSLKHLPSLFEVHPFCRWAAIPAKVQTVIHPKVGSPAF